MASPPFHDAKLAFNAESKPRTDEATDRRTIAPVPTVNLGDALAIFWERACFFLLEGLSDAIAFHAAVLRNPSIDRTGKTCWPMPLEEAAWLFILSLTFLGAFMMNADRRQTLARAVCEGGIARVGCR
jgi:hypothetical protein